MATCATEAPSVIQAALVKELAEATLMADAASIELRAINEIPSDMQRIYNASHKLTAARKVMTKAHARLNDYAERGLVPEDLKRSG